MVEFVATFRSHVYSLRETGVVINERFLISKALGKLTSEWTATIQALGQQCSLSLDDILEAVMDEAEDREGR